jgi:hypothetical protein
VEKREADETKLVGHRVSAFNTGTDEEDNKLCEGAAVETQKTRAIFWSAATRKRSHGGNNGAGAIPPRSRCSGRERIVKRKEDWPSCRQKEDDGFADIRRFEYLESVREGESWCWRLEDWIMGLWREQQRKLHAERQCDNDGYLKARGQNRREVATETRPVVERLGAEWEFRGATDKGWWEGWWNWKARS